MHSLKCTQMRARVEKVYVLGWNKYNSTISTVGANFMTTGVKDCYLYTPMDIFEYMRIHLYVIPRTLINQCNIHEIANKDGYVLV